MASIEMEAFYPYPAEHVWGALNQPAALEQWLMKNENYKPTAGQKFKFRAKPVLGWKGIAYCEVLKVEKPRQLVWRWAGEEGAKDAFTITWTLKEENGGTRLSLLHEGIGGLKGFLVKRVMGAGWKRMFEQRIPLVLDYAKQKGWEQFPADRRLTPADCHV